MVTDEDLLRLDEAVRAADKRSDEAFKARNDAIRTAVAEGSHKKAEIARLLGYTPMTITLICRRATKAKGG